MAELTLFYFRPGLSFLHSMDARIKLFAMMAISVVSMNAGVVAMCLATVLALGLLFKIRISVAAFLYETRYFFILLVFVLFARTLATPGEPIFTGLPMVLSMQGLISGSMLSWRLILIVILGLSLSATTRPAYIRQSIQWFLNPIPGVPSQKIGTMIGLLIRFIPVILIQSREIAEAQRARCIDQRRNPVYRVTCLCMSLLRKTFVSADRLALAMEARNYGHQRTPIPWHTRPQDWMALVFVCILCILMIMV